MNNDELKRKQEKKLTCFSFSQQVVGSHWETWLKEGEQSITDIRTMLARLKWKLDQIGCEVAEIYAITHNKDTTPVWVEE